MKVYLLEEQLWLAVCMEFEIRGYQSRRLNVPANWGRSRRSKASMSTVDVGRDMSLNFTLQSAL